MTWKMMDIMKLEGKMPYHINLNFSLSLYSFIFKSVLRQHRLFLLKNAIDSETQNNIKTNNPFKNS